MSADEEIETQLGAVFDELVELIGETIQAIWTASSSERRQTFDNLKTFVGEQVMMIDDAEARIGTRAPWVKSPTAHARNARDRGRLRANLFHVTNRESLPVLEECTRRGIAFVPFGSLGFGVTGPDAVLRRREVVEQAARLGVTSAQLVLAWALALAPNMLLIPGASSADHLRENLATSAVPLDAEAIDRLCAMYLPEAVPGRPQTHAPNDE